jgi:hypothetical protein
MKSNILNPHSLSKAIRHLVLLTFISCVGGTKSELVIENRSPSSNNSTLYQQHCMSCHGEIENSEKIGRTFTQIKGAIHSGAIAAMNGASLLALTDQELQEVADALNRPFPPGPPQTLQFKQILGGREYLISKFKMIFMNDGMSSSEETTIKNLIDDFLNKPGYLGGKCEHLAFCSNLFGITQQEDASAPVHPIPSVPRRGVLTKACQEILSLDTAVTNALTFASLTSSSTANEVNIEKLFTAMNPSLVINSTVSSGLINLHTEAKTIHALSDIEAWQMVIYALCVSPTFELI